MTENRQHRWDVDFLALAEWYANRKSKDPSTKTGAVIVATDGSIVSMGYNGFPRGVQDTEERYNDRLLKYKLIVHCERNAIIFGDRDRMQGGTLYTWPFASCSICAGMVIQAGIKRCVAPVMPLDKTTSARSDGTGWEHDMALAAGMFEEAGVELCLIDPVNGAPWQP